VVESAVNVQWVPGSGRATRRRSTRSGKRYRLAVNPGDVIFAAVATVACSLALATWLGVILHRRANDLLDEDDERRAALVTEALNEDDNRRGNAP